MALSFDCEGLEDKTKAKQQQAEKKISSFPFRNSYHYRHHPLQRQVDNSAILVKTLLVTEWRKTP